MVRGLEQMATDQGFGDPRAPAAPLGQLRSLAATGQRIVNCRWSKSIDFCMDIFR